MRTRYTINSPAMSAADVQSKRHSHTVITAILYVVTCVVITALVLLILTGNSVWPPMLASAAAIGCIHLLRAEIAERRQSYADAPRTLHVRAVVFARSNKACADFYASIRNKNRSLLVVEYRLLEREFMRVTAMREQDLKSGNTPLFPGRAQSLQRPAIESTSC